MKKLVLTLFGLFVVLWSCTNEKLDDETINGTNLSFSVDSECTLSDSDNCGQGPDFNLAYYAAFDPVYWGSTETHKLSFQPQADGSIHIFGTTKLLSGTSCIAQIDLWLVEGKTYTELLGINGEFWSRDVCTNAIVDPELLNYFKIDSSRSSITFTDCESDNLPVGQFEVENAVRYEWRQDKLVTKEVQIGPGAAFTDSRNLDGLSAWVDLLIDGQKIASKLYFTLDCFEDIECETAFARSDDGATCFSDTPEAFDRWGWTIGPLSEGDYTYEIYSGAGQCDISKGELVGTVDVSYMNGNVSFTYNIDSQYNVEETHSYAGNAMFPTNKKGNPTVAPGQYTIQEDLEGEIYVIAHAVVCN
ncbi:hypothetical protein [Lentiprolixibacter aurantiacus]|uniref:Uncharacterized protein n=1 Tax=Lentiprolixibacter aurantiacus TaxID=2993939 RepID=A0AAE3ML94_9FLAO|nr:hypothetical protein [Lentiprolixibacter aurantiacus]MCX2719816.1 hypothetical protein [Lentiprolixibacter aurantiacus]